MKKTALILALALCSVGCATSLRMHIGTSGSQAYEAVWDGHNLRTVAALPASGATYFANGTDGRYYSVSGRASVISYKDNEIAARCNDAGSSSCFILNTGHPYIFTAEYTGATVSVFSLENGIVTSMVQSMHFDGSGPHRNQKTAHMHQIRQLPGDMCKAVGIEGEWYLASDLGSDRIRCFRYVAESADSVLEYVPQLDVLFKPGSGPRHIEFNCKHGLIYCVTELSDEVVTFRLGESGGAPYLVQTSCIHADEAYAGGGADIHLSPDGEYLYSSHRLKADGIAIFRVSPSDGSLERIGYQYTESHPRNFAISPDGKLLFAACRDGKCVQVFDIDGKTGMLRERTSARLVLENDPPMCVILRDR